MTPSFRSDGSGWPWRARWVFSRSTSALARSNSSQVATIGNMIFSGAPGGGLQQGADLRAQQARPVEADADGAPAERRVLLLDGLHVGQDLVAADIEGAEGDRPVARRGEHGAVERLLLGGRGHALGDHELQLGAEQADAGGAGLVQMRQVDQRARH